MYALIFALASLASLLESGYAQAHDDTGDGALLVPSMPVKQSKAEASHDVIAGSMVGGSSDVTRILGDAPIGSDVAAEAVADSIRNLFGLRQERMDLLVPAPVAPMSAIQASAKPLPAKQQKVSFAQTQTVLVKQNMQAKNLAKRKLAAKEAEEEEEEEAEEEEMAREDQLAAARAREAAKKEAELNALAKKAAEKKAAQRAAAEKAAAEKAEVEKWAAQRAAAEKVLAEKAKAEKAAVEKAAAEKAGAEKAAADKAAAEKAATENEKAAKALAEKAAAEKAVAAKAVAAAKTSEEAKLEKVLERMQAENAKLHEKVAEFEAHEAMDNARQYLRAQTARQQAKVTHHSLAVEPLKRPPTPAQEEAHALLSSASTAATDAEPAELFMTLVPQDGVNPLIEMAQVEQETPTMTMFPPGMKQFQSAQLQVPAEESPSIFTSIARRLHSIFFGPEAAPKAAPKPAPKQPIVLNQMQTSKQDFGATANAAARDSLADVTIHDMWSDYEKQDDAAVEYVKREDRALRLDAETPKEKPMLPGSGEDHAGSTHISGFWEKLAAEDEGITRALQTGGEDISEYARLVDLQDARVAASVSDISGPAGEHLEVEARGEDQSKELK